MTSQKTNAQNAEAIKNSFNMNYVPPSPNIVALGKFGEIPVNLSTGIPAVNVPIYSYKGINNGLSLDISLNYHAGGNRIEEIASSEGLGWALNAGGVISRTVHGLPDDLDVYGYLALYPLDMPSTDIADNTAGLLDTYTKNAEDTEQDMFYFSFNGHSGSFVLDGHGKAIPLTKQAIKIQTLFSGKSIDKFIVTDEAGIQYVFQDKEVTTTTHLSAVRGTLSYNSGWYLSTIINPFSQDSIVFNYHNAVNYCNILGSESLVNSTTGGISIPASSSFSFAGSYTIQVKKISSITMPDNVGVNFYYSPVSRCDLKGDSILTEIKQQNLTTGSFKSFKLYQSYTTGSAVVAINPAPCTLITTVNSLNLRLRLDSTVETGVGGIRLRPYKFQYDDTYYLPSTDSKKQDLWGYYSGNINTSSTLVPQIFYSTIMLDGADRRVDSNAVKASSLIKVTYPTGGYSQFEYESNRAGDSKLIVPLSVTNAVTFNGDLQSKVTTFNVNNDIPTVLSYKFNMSAWCPNVATTCSFTYKIKSLDDLTTYTTVSFAYGDLNTTKIVNLNLPNGSYHLTWDLGTATICTCADVFGFSMRFNTINQDTNQFGGGLRIKSITNYNGSDHAFDVIKQFKYLTVAGLSSGYAAGRPDFTRVYADATTTSNTYLIRTANTNYPLIYSTGAVNYARVEVKNVGAVNQGKEVNYFFSYKEHLPTATPEGGAPGFPFRPFQTMDWYYGQLIQKEVYDGNGKLLNKVRNNYDVSSEELTTLNNFKVGVKQSNSNYTVGSQYPTLYLLKYYYWNIGHTNKIQTTNVDYSLSGDSTVSNIFFNYDPNYYTLSSEIVTTSKTDTLINKYYYPFNYSIAGSVYGAMVTANMISNPISSETWRFIGSAYQLIRADATSYNLFGLNYKPADYYTLNSVSPVSLSTIGAFNPAVLLRNPSLYEKRRNHKNYDVKGNLLTLSQEGGVNSSFIWAYNRQYPIAEIKNADYASVLSILTSSAIDNFCNQPFQNKTNIDNFLAPLRTGMPGAHITSFSYEPLLGLTSVTDPKGMSTFYEYDAFQRLLNIKDQDGNIMKNFSYHYAIVTY